MYLWLEQKQSGSYSFFWILVNLRDLFSDSVRNNKREHIQEQQPSQFHCYNQNMGFVNRMDQLLVKHRIDVQMKKLWWSLVVKLRYLDDAVLQVCEYCIILTMKMVSVCLSYFFEEMLSMQFFWNTQRKADYPRPM